MNETIVMQIGKSYIVTRPGEVIPGVGEFLPAVFSLEILEKPKRVLVDDGPGGLVIEIPTPHHLLQPSWYFVRNLKDNIKHWFCDTGCIIEYLTVAKHSNE